MYDSNKTNSTCCFDNGHGLTTVSGTELTVVGRDGLPQNNDRLDSARQWVAVP